MKELARLALVSKFWTDNYKERISTEQQRLKDLAAQAPFSYSGVAPNQTLLDMIPTTLPAVLTPSHSSPGTYIVVHIYPLAPSLPYMSLSFLGMERAGHRMAGKYFASVH